jgi:hypothetical protein
MSPLVSILIPTLDRPQYLAEAIDAALAQTYRNLEVLVFDNGTMDETLQIAEQAARVATLAAAMVPPVRVSFSNQYLIDGDGRRLDDRTQAHAQRYGRDSLPAGVIENADVASWQLSIPMSASLLHTDDMRRLRFREDMNTPDIEFFIRLAREGAAFCFVPERLMEYRVHLGAESAGGLWSEQLVECLTSYKVRPEVEPYKRQLLAPIVVNAVSRSLQRGDMKKARALLRNKYYPRRVTASGEAGGLTGHPLHSGLPRRNGSNPALRHSVGRLLQGFCAHLPPVLGAPIYRSVRRVRQASKGHSS